jgi:hypothetical protein
MVGNDPILAEADWTGNDHLVLMIDTTDAKRVPCLVFGTVRYFIVEGAEAMRTIPLRYFGLVCNEVTEDLS